MTLELDNLTIKLKENNKEIIKQLSLSLAKGEVVALMGPNGSGKSTLAQTIMGHPSYEIKEGKILLDNQDITQSLVEERAKKGLFLSFQHPSEIDGVKLETFLRNSYQAKTGEKISVLDFHNLLKEKLKLLKMDPSFLKRYLNFGFSGGEKKRSEILQMALLQPTYAILDETDSGLDIDALKTVAQGINTIKQTQTQMGILLITHYTRILKYIQPDRVLVMVDGKIIKQGGPELAHQLEENGYDDLIPETNPSLTVT